MARTDVIPAMMNLKYTLSLAAAGLLCLLAADAAGAEDRLRPFTTDGCSDFPNGTPAHKELWLRCCIAHDRKYWLGGTYRERLQADQELRTCVQAVGEPAVAALMLAGVRVGGSPYWPTRFRWGYGWPYTHGYRALTPEELAQAKKLEPAAN